MAGKKRKHQTERFELRVSPEVRHKLDILAKRYGMSNSQVIRGLIIRQTKLLKLDDTTGIEDP